MSVRTWVRCNLGLAEPEQALDQFEMALNISSGMKSYKRMRWEGSERRTRSFGQGDQGPGADPGCRAVARPRRPQLGSRQPDAPWGGLCGPRPVGGGSQETGGSPDAVPPRATRRCRTGHGPWQSSATLLTSKTETRRPLLVSSRLAPFSKHRKIPALSRKCSAGEPRQPILMTSTRLMPLSRRPSPWSRASAVPSRPTSPCGAISTISTSRSSMGPAPAGAGREPRRRSLQCGRGVPLTIAPRRCEGSGGGCPGRGSRSSGEDQAGSKPGTSGDARMGASPRPLE